jgi:hypothetical protein
MSVDSELDLYFGIVAQEFGQLRPKHRVNRMLPGCDSNAAGGLFPELAQGL